MPFYFFYKPIKKHLPRDNGQKRIESSKKSREKDKRLTKPSGTSCDKDQKWKKYVTMTKKGNIT